MAKDTKESAPPGIAKRWPTLLMIKLGRITMHRFTEELEPFGIRPRHVAALIELRDSGELTQQSLCGQLHLDPTNLVAILNVEGLLTSIWERSGGYEAWSQVAAEADDRAA